MKTDRISWIDGCKAFGICLIVAGHVFATLMHMTSGSASKMMRLFFDFLYLFHVPLFFTLSGLTFSTNNNSFYNFIKKKFFRLMVPYYVYGFLGAFIYIYLGSHITAEINSTATTSAFSDKILHGAWYAPLLSIVHAGGWPDGKGFCFNGVLWFLPVLFLSELLWFWMSKIIKNALHAFIIFCSLIFILVCFNSWVYGVRLPFNFSLQLRYLPFLAFGFWIRFIHDKMNLNELKNNIDTTVKSLSCLILCLYISYIISDNQRMSLYWITRSVCAAMIILVLISFAQYRFFNALSFIAPFTLGIMLFHKYPLVIAQVIIGRMKLAFLNEPWFVTILSILLTFGLTFICYYASKLVLRFAPWSLGVKCNRQC